MRTDPPLSPPAQVRADFDRLARLDRGGFDHNVHYHRVLLRALPARIGCALDLGCGTGGFSRRLAARAESVLGIDLAPEMIRIARERAAGIANLRFEERDFAGWEAPRAHFDAVASIATLHHLPLAPTLARLRAALRPGGTLLVLDIVRDAGLRDLATSALAVGLNPGLNLVKTGRLRAPAAVRAAWIEHGRTDHYASLGEVRAACSQAGLADARIERLLFWRYALIWRKPGASSAIQVPRTFNPAAR